MTTFEERQKIYKARGIQARTPDEATRFANLIDKQFARDSARSALLLAEYELDDARKLMDGGQFVASPHPSPAKPEDVAAERAVEMALAARLRDRVASATKRVLARTARRTRRGSLLFEPLPLGWLADQLLKLKTTMEAYQRGKSD